MPVRAPGFAPLLLAATMLSLTACGDEPADSAPQRSEIVESDAPPEADAGRNTDEVIEADDDGEVEALPQGTPPSERVATLGLLNKRNNLTQDIELRPGEQVVIDDVRVRLSICEKTPPWETPPESGAFAQLDVRPPGRNADFERVFSGWLFKNSPSLNVVEHPIYDLWIKDCAMTFPGEEAPDTSDS